MSEFNLDDLLKDLNKKDNAASSTSGNSSSNDTNLEPDQLQQMLKLCQMKAEEFELIGYDKVNKEAIWRYFASKYRNQFPPLHRIVNEILTLKITTLMNWETINAYKGINDLT